MSFAIWMLLVAAFLPYIAVALAKSGGADNRVPRLELERLSGWRQRADWAHRNHFEAFPPFAAAVIVAELAHVPQARIDWLAALFVAARIVYTGAYLADLATLRSTAWGVGFFAVVALFVTSAWG